MEPNIKKLSVAAELSTNDAVRYKSSEAKRKQKIFYITNWLDLCHDDKNLDYHVLQL